MSNYDPKSTSRHVSSFADAAERLREQVDFGTLTEQEPEWASVYNEMIYVAADAYTHDVRRELPMGGETVTYAQLQEIYELLRAEHLQYVREQIDNYGRPIKHKKAFIRVALYNSVFEIETAAANMYAVTHVG